MKRTFLILTGAAVLFLFGFKAAEKTYTINLTQGEVSTLWNVLQYSKLNLASSDAPAREVKQVVTSIDSLSVIISKQYSAQVKADTTKKDPASAVKQKK